MPDKKNKTNLLDKVFLILNIGVITLLLLAYLSTRVSPEKFWLLAFFGLAYPIFLILNLFFIIYWLFRNMRKSIFSIVAILIGYGFVGKYFQIAGKSIGDFKSEYVKVMSYNVKLFDLYNYKKDWSYNFTNRNNIFRFIDESQPDILCLQEYFYDSENHFVTRDSLTAILKTKYYYEYFPFVKNIHHYGIATFSKYPIINSGMIIFKNITHNSAIFSDIVVKNDTFRVYNAHLQSIKLNKEDFVFTSSGNNKSEDLLNSEFAKDSKKMLQKLKSAYVMRANQAEMLNAHIHQSPYPVIVCGDFNDTPCSYATRLISKNLIDAFVASGRGFGQTYNGKMPSFRIDYILYDKIFESRGYKTITSIKASDHYPIYTYIKKQE